MLNLLGGQATAASASGSRRSGAPSATLSKGSGPLAPVTIHVFSDIACPWCHIGARRLQRAVRQYKRRYGQAAPLKLQWNPLLVDADVTTAGEDVDSYAQRRWGNNSVGQVKSRLVRAGLPEGATFMNWRTMPNSLLAHELMALATDAGIAEQANDLLFARTYEQGGNISLLGELLDIGEALGMQRAELGKELMRADGGSLRATVLERDAAAKRRLRIQAVPHFIITAGPNCRTKYSLNGAHQTSDLLGAMERVAMEEARPRTASSTTYGGMLGSVQAAAATRTLLAC